MEVFMSRMLRLLAIFLTLTHPVRAQDVVPGRLMVKFQTGVESRLFKSGSELDANFRLFGVTHRVAVLAPGETRRLKSGPLPDDLERTFEIRYLADLDPEFVASKIRRIPGVAYAEPMPVLRTQYVPNDSLHGATGQDFHAQHRIEAGWGLTQGSSDIVIAIVDSGVDYTHPDLAGKLWRNPSPGLAASLSPLFSQIANDSIGWNFWDSGPITAPVQTADPRPNGSSHGTHVAGLAAADTDNRIGISGTGFRSLYMAVRAGGTVADPTSIGFGYQGILYAALNGAHVINCSFGGTTYSQFGADIVAFATAMGSLVVGAAGNTGTETSFYPASFPETISVGSLTSTGTRSLFSSHGYDLDVMARGSNLLSTVRNGAYALNTGTSMAAPVVSGIAALVRHRYPDWGPDRVRHQIRSSADASIYSLNAAFLDKLGTGAVDAFTALDQPRPGIGVVSVAFTGPDGTKLGIGDSGTLTIRIRNRAARAIDLTVTPSTPQTGVVVGNGSAIPVGSVSESESRTLTTSIRIEPGFDLTRDPFVKLSFRDPATGYDDFHVIRYEGILIDTVDVNRWTTTFAANGTIGYSDAFSGSGGLGARPQGLAESVLYEAGLMVSVETDAGPYLINQVRGTNRIVTHFQPSDPFIVRRPGTVSDADGSAAFTSTGYPNAPRLSVAFDTYAFGSPEVDRVIFLRYALTNASTAVMRNIRVGLYADWDIGNYDDNSVAYSAPDSILYAYSPSETDTYPYVAIAHLGRISSALAIDNAYEGPPDSLRFGTYFSPSSAVFDGFTDPEKSAALRAGTRFTEVSGSDVAMVTAVGPFTMEPGQTLVTGFIMAYGETLDLLRSQVAAARAMRLFQVTTSVPDGDGPSWTDRPTQVRLLPPVPNPFNPTTTVRILVPEVMSARVEVFDALGRRVAVLADATFDAGEHRIGFDARGLASGVYRLRVTTPSGTDSRSITLLR
jgi:serine protease